MARKKSSKAKTATTKTKDKKIGATGDRKPDLIRRRVRGRIALIPRV